MPPLGIFGRGATASLDEVEQRQDEENVNKIVQENVNKSVHGNSDPKRNSTNAPLRSIFRGLGSSRHGMNESIHAGQAVEKISSTPSAQIVDEKAEMEKEYLNIINALSREQQEARDEIMRRTEETSALSASKRDLELKVSELEAKYEKLKNESELREKADPQEGEQPKLTQSFSFDSERSNNLEMIKKTLKEHRQSNDEMNNRVQRLREKYARRRAQADDMSETSSVVSFGTVRTSVSTTTAAITSPRHYMAEAKKIQMKYEQEKIRNAELKESIKHLDEEKKSLEAKLNGLAAMNIDGEHAERSSEIEGLKIQLAAEKSKFEESEKSLAELRQSKDSMISEKEKEISSLKMKLTEQSIRIAELQNEINIKEAEIMAIKKNQDVQLNEKIKDIEIKLSEKEAELDKVTTELSTVRQEMESIRSTEKAVAPEHPESGITDAKNDGLLAGQSASDTTSSLDENLDNLRVQKNTQIKELQDEVSKLKTEITDLEKVQTELSAARKEVESKDKEISVLKEEYEKSKKNLGDLELDFVVVQEKSAKTFQELEDIREKYQSQVEKNKELQQTIDHQSSYDPQLPARLQDAEDNIRKLREEIQTKEEEIKSLKSQSGKESTLHQQMEGLKLEMASLKLELANKKEELQNLKEEKNKSHSQLETIQQDMLTIQLKSSATFDELEDLKDRYDKEIQEKMSLKEQLEKFSPEEILAQAKKENDTELKQRDSEIHALKKQLTDANIAKTEIELRLMEVMNDVVATQSTRDLMKNELEVRLDEENEKAQHLELLIRGKEEDMERMRKEFEDLRIKMEKETDSRRNEITHLNGEVVEKSSLLSSRERDFLQLRADMDELKLKHEAEVSSLMKQINEFGANEKEVQRVHRKNMALESEVAALRNEIRLLHMNGNDMDPIMSPQSSMRVLRTRNDELKGQVEKLQRKLRYMKKNITRIEL